MSGATPSAIGFVEAMKRAPKAVITDIEGHLLHLHARVVTSKALVDGRTTLIAGKIVRLTPTSVTVMEDESLLRLTRFPTQVARID